MSGYIAGSDDGLDATLIPVDDGVLDEMLAFGALHYPAGDPYRSRTYREWLFLANPHGRAIAAVVRHEGALIGQAALIPVRFRMPEGGIQSGHFVVDVLTHPEHRNRRLFSRIIDAAMEGARRGGSWLLGHPNSAAMPGWKRKEMQFRPPLAPRFLVPSPFGHGRWEWNRDRILARWPDVESAVLSSDVPEIDRTADFVEWRFFRRPDKTYKTGLLLNGDAIPIAWQASTPWRHGVQLLVDHACARRTHLAAGLGKLALLPPGEESVANAFRLPVRKEVPFFLTDPSERNVDCRRVTLAASDF